jgi:pimeloyl-ACP methyl ester carboxylesterase
MPQFRTIDAGEVALRCALEGEGPLVILVHGFPESWFSWRHQLAPIAAAGFTAGDRDPAFNGFGRIANRGAVMRQHATDLRAVHVLPGCGHWTQQERPAQTTAILLDWLGGLPA